MSETREVGNFDAVTLDHVAHTTGTNSGFASGVSQSESELRAVSIRRSSGHSAPRLPSNTESSPPIWRRKLEEYLPPWLLSDSKDTIIASLQQHINENQRQLDHMASHLRNVMRMRDEENFALRKAEEDLRLLQEQLVVFKRTEYADSRSLRHIFADLQKEIDDLAHSLRKKLNSNVKLGLESDSALRVADHPRLRQLSDFFALSIAHNFGPQTVLTYAMRYIICATLVDTVFSKFCVDQSELGAALTTVDRRMQQWGSQVVRGRWRAMAFHALRTTDSDAETTSNVATDILQQISQLITAVTQPSEDGCQWVVDDSLPRAVSLVNTALKLHDATQGEYVSIDYRVFLPNVFEPVQSDQVEEDEAAQKRLARSSAWPVLTTINMSGAGVLLPTSLGLHAVRVNDGATVMSEFDPRAKVLLVVPLAQQ